MVFVAIWVLFSVVLGRVLAALGRSWALLGPLGLFWGFFFSCLYLEWSSKVLLEASVLHFVSILKGLGWILGGFGVVFGMDFRGFFG